MKHKIRTTVHDILREAYRENMVHLVKPAAAVHPAANRYAGSDAVIALPQSCSLAPGHASSLASMHPFYFQSTMPVSDDPFTAAAPVE